MHKDPFYTLAHGLSSIMRFVLVQKGDIWPGILQRVLYTRYISSVNLTNTAGAKLKQCHCDGGGGGDVSKFLLLFVGFNVYYRMLNPNGEYLLIIH